jgi:hypothetical protein
LSGYKKLIKKVKNMKKLNILFLAAIAISVIAISMAQTNKISLTEVRDCYTREWETEEPVYGTCQQESTQRICDDPPANESCREETNYYDYECQTGTNIIPHSERVCTPKAFEITKEDAGITTETARINYKEWGQCSHETDGDNLIIICDSQYDGNNDGICQSGESCVKFIITEKGTTRYVKNSQDDFTEEDDSFFLQKLDYEVVE